MYLAWPTALDGSVLYFPNRGHLLWGPRQADHAKGRRHLLLLAKVIQGGDKLAGGQITARAEDDD
jgi:hypothetical protein